LSVPENLGGGESSIIRRILAFPPRFSMADIVVKQLRWFFCLSSVASRISCSSSRKHQFGQTKPREGIEQPLSIKCPRPSTWCLTRRDDAFMYGKYRRTSGFRAPDLAFCRSPDFHPKNSRVFKLKRGSRTVATSSHFRFDGIGGASRWSV
jgi:hypothetical protein